MTKKIDLTAKTFSLNLIEEAIGKLRARATMHTDWAERLNAEFRLHELETILNEELR